MSKNAQIVNELVSLRSSMTALINKKNNLLHSQIETKYFTDLRFGEMIREMDEIARYLESALEDMKSLRELFTIKRRIDMKREREKRFGWFDHCEGKKEESSKEHRGILTEKNNLTKSQSNMKRNNTNKQSGTVNTHVDTLTHASYKKGNSEKRQSSTPQITTPFPPNDVKHKACGDQADIDSTLNTQGQTNLQSTIEKIFQPIHKKNEIKKPPQITPRRASFDITKKPLRVTQPVKKSISDSTLNKSNEKFNELMQSLIRAEESNKNDTMGKIKKRKKIVRPKRMRKK